jgi:hypothetical protein
MFRVRPQQTMRLAILAAAVISITVFMAAPVFADTNTGTPGQPNQSCQAVFGVQNPPFPAPAPSGFNTAGFIHATGVYAGSGQNTQTPANSNAVSQYDVACFQTAAHVP